MRALNTALNVCIFLVSVENSLCKTTVNSSLLTVSVTCFPLYGIKKGGNLTLSPYRRDLCARRAWEGRAARKRAWKGKDEKWKKPRRGLFFIAVSQEKSQTLRKIFQS